MRTILAALLASAFVALPSAAQTYGLGMGAASGDSVVLKIDGRDRTISLGTGTSTIAAESFLKCLVTDRVIRVERTRSGTKLLMLDKSNVADHLHEFLETKTTTDPCALGKAAYTPVLARLAAPAEAAVAAPPVAEAAPQPARPAAKKRVARTPKQPAPMPNGGTEVVLGPAAPRSMPNASGAAAGAQTPYQPKTPYQQPTQAPPPTMPVGTPAMGPTPTTMPSTTATSPPR